MMKLVCSFLLLLAAVVAVVPAGCNSGVTFNVSEKWTDELINWIVQWLEEKTGIEIEKGNVQITPLGVRKAESGDGHVCDYRITVKYRQTEHPITAKDVPCNAEGKPTKEGEARLKDSIKGIKGSIKTMQEVGG